MMDEKQELIQRLNADFMTGFPDDATMNDLQDRLSACINDLIVHNFTKLINLLYRLDVSEKKLHQWLLENTATDAGKIIAALVIERELQKIKSRSGFQRNDGNIDENELW
jgi:hypothetical protein